MWGVPQTSIDSIFICQALWDENECMQLRFFSMLVSGAAPKEGDGTG